MLPRTRLFARKDLPAFLLFETLFQGASNWSLLEVCFDHKLCRSFMPRHHTSAATSQRIIPLDLTFQAAKRAEPLLVDPPLAFRRFGNVWQR